MGVEALQRPPCVGVSISLLNSQRIFAPVAGTTQSTAGAGSMFGVPNGIGGDRSAAAAEGPWS
jgi:hypothetical protein